ncbi:MAG: YbaK/EbsC family protein, partial [Hyphomicrobiaceae bacterium]|nr:YbaK/EbsC family protein [Hyphomicrobiaceae bacterium]
GAVPPLAEPYAVDAFIDESLDEQPDIYLEGGDHRSLIHIPGSQFRALTKNVRHARISTPA